MVWIHLHCMHAYISAVAVVAYCFTYAHSAHWRQRYIQYCSYNTKPAPYHDGMDSRGYPLIPPRRMTSLHSRLHRCPIGIGIYIHALYIDHEEAFLCGIWYPLGPDGYGDRETPVESRIAQMVLHIHRKHPSWGNSLKLGLTERI